jgi:hypothetical protein
MKVSNENIAVVQVLMKRADPRSDSPCRGAGRALGSCERRDLTCRRRQRQALLH